MSDPMQYIHKAAPSDPDSGLPVDECAACGDTIRLLPAGQGWVHSDGYVMGRNADAPAPPDAVSFTFTIMATIAGTDRQDAWDRWVEWLREPAHLEDYTQVQQEDLIFLDDTAAVRVVLGNPEMLGEALRNTRALNYAPTHVSKSDGSDAMLISQGPEDVLTLCNENGDVWVDEADLWEAL